VIHKCEVNREADWPVSLQGFAIPACLPLFQLAWMRNLNSCEISLALENLRGEKELEN